MPTVAPLLRRLLAQIFATTAFRFCAGFGIGVWCAPFFRGRFPSSITEFSVLNAFVVAGGGLLSSFLGGVISDKYAVQVRAQRLQLSCCLLVLPREGVVARDCVSREGTCSPSTQV